MVRKETKLDLMEMVEEYLAECKLRGLSVKTQENYRRDLRRMLGSYTSLDKSCCTRAVEALQSVPDISLNSVNHYVRCLKTFVKWAEEQGYCEHIDIKTVRGQKPSIKLYTDNELTRLLQIDRKKASFVEHRTFLLISIVLATGARAETLRNLKLDDIDWGGKNILFAHLKNKSTFHSPMSPQLEKELKIFLQSWKRSKQDGYLLCEEDEQQASYNALRLGFERYCAKRGVKCKGMHALRHTFATAYIRAGGSLPFLSRQLTHSSLAITERYIHIVDSDLRANIEQLSSLDRLTAGRIRR